MYITNVTEYDNGTDDYNNRLSINNNCTNNGNNIDINILTFLLTIPIGLSFSCFLSLMIYTLIKPLLNNK